MRGDYSKILNSYTEILPVLETISQSLEQELENRVGNEKHVDRVICRCKTVDSFMKKAEKINDRGEYKYQVPLKEIQDKIGARIVVYYKSDIEPIRKIVTDYFK